MSDNTGKGFENLSREEKLTEIKKMLDKFLTDANEQEMAEVMVNVMPKMMGNGMSMMEKMCHRMMGTNMFGQENQERNRERAASCCGENKETTYATLEIKNLFEDWVRQVQEEIDKYRKENKCAGKKEIADYLKISDESLEYFIKDMKSEVSPCGCGLHSDTSVENRNDTDYEVVKIEKIKNVCPMCENYAKQQAEKPIVIMSCEGACLRGEISRRAANLICYSLAPEKTVRLCLGGAFTKDEGQRNLVRNAKRVIALEGCFIKCASRMIKGVVNEANPEIIITDNLFSFNTNIFGINEMAEEDIKANSFEVAKKIAVKL